MPKSVYKSDWNKEKSMVSFEGKVKNGIIVPLKLFQRADEGRKVLITFVEDALERASSESGLSLKALVDDVKVDVELIAFSEGKLGSREEFIRIVAKWQDIETDKRAFN